jgi:membrane protease YdiL (CAAX protease family)
MRTCRSGCPSQARSRLATPWPCSPPQVALSSALFAAMHLDGPSFLPLTALGAALGATYLASGGSLLACSLAHGLYNAAALLSLF